KKIRTISADFTQEKHSAMLARPLLYKGKFKFRAPNKVAWTYEGEVQMASDGVYLTVFYPELMEAEVVPVQNSMIRLPLSFNLEEFRKHFTLSASEEDGVYKVVLTPREDSVLFSQMVVRLTRDGVPSSAEILEKIGDRSIIRFSNQKINQELSERDFTINLPKGTVVRRRGSQ
ncbi:MAG: LolA family protein, partial [Thermodesulfovibrionales bacterium]